VPITAAPPGLNTIWAGAKVQGLAPLANDGHPSGAQTLYILRNN
jgi:hypothetical protein